MSAASDRDAIAASLTGGVALCGDCIARNISAPLWRVHSDLAELAKTQTVIKATGRCRDCEKHTAIYRLA